MGQAITILKDMKISVRLQGKCLGFLFSDFFVTVVVGGEGDLEETSTK